MEVFPHFLDNKNHFGVIIKHSISQAPSPDAMMLRVWEFIFLNNILGGSDQ
jgi:hypothetical protein